VEKHPAFSSAGLRWMLQNRQTNGMDTYGVVLKLGRAVYIDEDKFFEWFRAKAS
jgi:hypothetical protein